MDRYMCIYILYDLKVGKKGLIGQLQTKHVSQIEGDGETMYFVS